MLSWLCKEGAKSGWEVSTSEERGFELALPRGSEAALAAAVRV